jgi:hypothetical protein
MKGHRINKLQRGNDMRRSASEIIRDLESRIARLEKSAYTSWEETATQELIEELRLDPNEVSYEIDFIAHDAQVLSVKTRWDEYILFQFEDEYDNFMDRELMERVENMSYTTLTKILVKSRQPLINFAPYGVSLEVEDTDFLKDLPQYRNILKKVKDESMQSELIFELCEKLNRNPLLVTKSEKVIKRLYEYLSIDIMEMAEEFGITPKHYEEVGSLRESYALRVI